MINLGMTYKDRITGFTGVATGFVRYITGCNQVLLAPRCSDDGALRDSQWFDQQRVDEQPQFPPVALDNGSTPGCDRAAPRR
jgi:hypothetical protein